MDFAVTVASGENSFSKLKPITTHTLHEKRVGGQKRITNRSVISIKETRAALFTLDKIFNTFAANGPKEETINL